MKTALYELVNRKGEVIDFRKLSARKVKEDNEKFAAHGLSARWRKKKS